MKLELPIPKKDLARLCRRHEIAQLWLFGSALRSDFGPESDIDLLVSFDAKARLSAFDFIDLQEELRELLGRPVDLVQDEAVVNPFHRREIDRTRKLLYAA